MLHSTSLLFSVKKIVSSIRIFIKCKYLFSASIDTWKALNRSKSNMKNLVDSYKLGNIEVKITKSDHPEKLDVECNDGTYRSAFTIRKYEYQHYKRHMNQRIKNAYKEQHEEDS